MYSLPEVASAARVFAGAVAEEAATISPGEDLGSPWSLGQTCGWPLVGEERGRWAAVVAAPVYKAQGRWGLVVLLL